jgi:hypothetical protein
MTRAEAERARAAQSSAPPPSAPAPRVDELTEGLRGRIEIEGARLSYRQNCASMQRVHVSPAIGKRRVDKVTHRDIERLVRAMLAGGAGAEDRPQRHDLPACGRAGCRD